MNVAKTDTGTATVGTSTARKLPRKTKMITTTRITAMISAR